MPQRDKPVPGNGHTTEKHCVPDIPYSCACSPDLLQQSQRNPQFLFYGTSVVNQPMRLFVISSGYFRDTRLTSVRAPGAPPRLPTMHDHLARCVREPSCIYGPAPSKPYARSGLVGSLSSSGTSFFKFESIVISKRRTAWETSKFLAPQCFFL
jgi:hypothetical protein